VRAASCFPPGTIQEVVSLLIFAKIVRTDDWISKWVLPVWWSDDQSCLSWSGSGRVSEWKGSRGRRFLGHACSSCCCPDSPSGIEMTPAERICGQLIFLQLNYIYNSWTACVTKQNLQCIQLRGFLYTIWSNGRTAVLSMKKIEYDIWMVKNGNLIDIYYLEKNSPLPLILFKTFHIFHFL
jgi:hypothetical protein